MDLETKILRNLLALLCTGFALAWMAAGALVPWLNWPTTAAGVVLSFGVWVLSSLLLGCDDDSADDDEP